MELRDELKENVLMEEEIVEEMDIPNSEEISEKILKENDQSVVENIKEIISKYEVINNQKIKYIDRGGVATVFEIGDKVIKFDSYTNKNLTKNIPLIADVAEKVSYNVNGIERKMEIIEKLDTKNITMDDVQYVYNVLRSKGFIWLDGKEDNLGRTVNKDVTDPKDKLRLLDDGYIFEEEKLKEQNYDNVFELVVSGQPNTIFFEIDYQKSLNPEFDIDDLKDYFHKYTYDTYTKERVDDIISEYKDRSKKENLKKDEELR